MNTKDSINLERAQMEMVTFWSFRAPGHSRNTAIRSVLMWIDVKYSKEATVAFSFPNIHI